MNATGSPAPDSAAAGAAGSGRRDSRGGLALGGACAAFAFAIYLKTAAPGAWWGDGLELACAAKTFGIPHPPGYPLYTILAGLWMRALPFADPGRATTLFSTTLCAATVWAFGTLLFARTASAARGAYRDCRNPSPTRERGDERIWSAEAMPPLSPARPCLAPAQESASGGDPNASPDNRERPPAAIGSPRIALAVAGTTLSFAFARTFWDHATFAEVYPLAVLLSVLLVAECSRRAAGKGANFGAVVPLAALCGLATLHHYSVGALAPLALATLAARLNAIRREAGARAALRGLVAFALVWFAFALVWLWLPIRARANPALNWGDPSSFARFVWMLTGGDYGTYNVAHAPFGTRVVAGGLRWFRWLGGEFLPLGGAVATVLGAILTALGVAGCLGIARAERVFGLGLAASILLCAGFAIAYPIPDLEPYFLPALPALFLGWIDRARAALARLPDARLLPALPAALALAMLAARFGAIDKSWDDGPERWAEAALAALPPDAVLVARGGVDSEIYALWYERICEGARPDVVVVGGGFVFQGWYARHFEAEGRPRAPVFVRERPIGDKSVFDVALLGGTVAPSLAEGRRVFATYADETLLRYANPRPVPAPPLLPPAYYEATAYPFALPPPAILELKPDAAALAAFDRAFREEFGNKDLRSTTDPP